MDYFGVSFGITVGEEVKEDILFVVDVDMVVDDDDEFGEGHLAGAPDGVHHSSRMVRIFLFDFDEDAVVEYAGDGEVVIDDVGDERSEEWEENSFGGFAKEIVFHGGFADDGGGVDGIFSVSDGGDVEGGVPVGEAVEAGVVAEGAFH